jgi:hypothetical protein
MFYEVTSKRTIVDLKGNDKEIAEKYLFENLEFFAEAEQKMYEHLNNENTVTAIKQCKIMEFVNQRGDNEQSIYYATIESIFVDENTGEEKATKYVVGLFAKSIDEANRITNEYMKQGLADLVLVGIRKTKIVDLI